MLKVIVAGSRGFDNYELLQEKLDFYLRNHDDVEIVSGTARGADRLGERYAIARGLPLKKFSANWNKYGKKAGYLRNEQMVNYADACVVFWDGKSKGSKHTIDLAKKHGLKVRIVRF